MPMKQFLRKLRFAALTALLLALCAPSAAVAAASDDSRITSPVTSRKVNRQDYVDYAYSVRSALYQNADKTFTRVEHLSDEDDRRNQNIRRSYNDAYLKDTYIAVEQYTADFNFISGHKIKMELPLYGGFFAGKDYNFIVFGQLNLEESSRTEVYKIVKYGKDWKNLDEASVRDCNPTSPFLAGSLRMAEYGDMLYIRTTREMYKNAANDGKIHQVNLTINVSIPKMAVTKCNAEWRPTGGAWGIVTHSFNQFVSTAGGKITAVDHGDATPRAVVLNISNARAGSATLSGKNNSEAKINLLNIAGDKGDNKTGVSVGAYIAGKSSYLVAGNSIVQDKNYKNRVTRNIFVTVTPIYTLYLGSFRH